MSNWTRVPPGPVQDDDEMKVKVTSGSAWTMELLVCLVVLAAASAAASAAPPAAPPATGEVSVDLGREAAWAACRPTAKVTAAAISLPGVFAPGSPAVECVHGIAAAPATAFAVLQRNGTFTEVGIGTAHDDPFVDDMLYRAPDINASAGFYTLVWRTEIPTVVGRVQVLQLRGVNYAVSVFANGTPLPDAATGETSVEGMFRRSEYVLPADPPGGMNIIGIKVTPPPFVGQRCNGQGGAHILAKSVTAQFSAGWDCIASTPDRNTGLWDKVTLGDTRTRVYAQYLCEYS